MGNPEEESVKVTGVKMYLRRKYQDADSLAALADQCFIEASDEVVITSTEADGSSAMGQIRFPKWLLLTAVEELIIELGFQPLTSRQLGTRPDYSRTWSVT
jgi:hypothetical protein